MSAFLTPITDHQIGPKLFQLDEDFRYRSDLVCNIITVPKGFITDYESCPVWLPIINSLFGDVADQPAIIHDWLYYTALYDRETCDQILVEAMCLIPGLSDWRINGIYYGLRIGGWAAWNAHRKAHHSLEDFKNNAPEVQK